MDLLSNPNLWKDDAGNTPPSYWNGTAYVFNSGPTGGPTQYIELLSTAPVGAVCTANFDNLAACPGSNESNHVVQMLDLNRSPNSPYYQNGTDMLSVGSWQITTGTLEGTEKIQIICNSQDLTFYAYDFTLTPPITFTADNETDAVQQNSSANALPYQLVYNGETVTPTALQISTAPTHGTAIIEGLSILYTPTPGFYGTDTLQYTGTYASDTSSPGTITITVIQADSRVRLRWTDDGGHNWAPFQETSMGPIGQTAERVLFRRTGSTRRNSGLDRVFEISSDAPTQVCLVGASFVED